MSKATNLVMACRRAEAAIDRATRYGKGAHKTREAMRRDLALWFTTFYASDEYERLISLRLPWKAWDSDLKLQSFRLAFALHLIGSHHVSPARAVSESGTAKINVDHATALLKRVGLSVHELSRQQSEDIATAVQAHTEEMHVRLEARALEDILLAAAEGYLPSRGSKFTEVFGLCFGSVRSLSPKHVGSQSQINVSRVATQIRARGTAYEVQPNWKSLTTHLDVADKFFPHLEVVGDYHTHPYRSLTHLLKNRGWEHSTVDEQSLGYLVGKVQEHRSRPRFSLVVAVALGGKSGKGALRRRSNVIQVSVADLFFVVGAYRIRGDATYDDEVTLHLPAMI